MNIVRAADLPCDLHARIMAKVTIDANGCWIYNGNRHGKCSYGFIYRGNAKTISCHRAMWLIHNGGELVPTDFICHTCDVGPCCNPAHLFKGDLTANNKDMAAKGRYNHQKVTHCPVGHDYATHGGWYGKRKNKRCCLPCRLARHRRRAGWPEHLVFLPAGTPGVRPEGVPRANYRKTQRQKASIPAST